MKIFFVLLFVFVYLFVYVSPTSAMSTAQRDAYASGIRWADIDPPAANCKPLTTTGTIQGNNVYMLGDSITVGGTADLTREFTEKSLVIGKINGVIGRAISAPGEGTETGQQALVNDSAEIAAADAIIVELGTNATGATSEGINSMISGIKAVKKPSAKIFWVNIFSAIGTKDEFNQLLSNGYIEQGYTIIDTTSAGIELSTDDVHPTPSGYTTFAKTVADSLVSDSATVVDATPIGGVDITVYSPQQGGDNVEGGYESSREGLDGAALVRTLDDYNSGTTSYITLAGDPAQYGKTYTIPTITYDSYSTGQKQTTTLNNVKAYVHDTGSAFVGQPEGRYDVAVGKDYTDEQMNSQPFANHSDPSNPKIQLIPYSEQAAGQEDLAGCVCSANVPAIGQASQEENYQNTWNFFTTNKGLSAEATAGIMGNLEAESGINPWNTQNNAKDSSGNPVPDGPEIPIDLIRDRFGYGIAQWTTGGRQQNLVDFANNSSPKRSTGDLGLQLDFLWQELTTSYASVLAKLQTPGVTLEDSSDEVVLRFEIPASVLPPPRGTAASKQKTLEDRRRLSAKIFDTYSGRPAGSYSSNACASSGAGSVVIDLETIDTSSIPCAPNTTQGEISDAYNGGNSFTIRLCVVDGARVNSQISGPLKNMMDKAIADGVALGIGDGFRDMQGQIDTYLRWCSSAGVSATPGPYPKASSDDYTKCPGAAPPGYSNHQMGLAFDFTCNDTSIPQGYTEAQSNECYNWLVQNAQNYGLFEWGKGADRTKAGYEAWHWSVDGS